MGKKALISNGLVGLAWNSGYGEKMNLEKNSLLSYFIHEGTDHFFRNLFCIDIILVGLDLIF